jgi:signal transduction histidine kinase/streptogramin lyase
MRVVPTLLPLIAAALLTTVFAGHARADELPAALESGAESAHAGAPLFDSLVGGEASPAEIITEVRFDRTGFLWIGTREGLYLYDGQHFRKFQHDAQGPDSISSNGVRGVFEDSRGRLWINTISGGLDLLDRATWRFRSWRHDRNTPDSLAHDGVFDLAEAPGGKLWVGTQAGLDLFDPDSGRFEHQILATGGEFVIALLTDSHGRLWIGTLGQGLFRSSADGRHFDPVLGIGGAAPLDIFSLAEDAEGGIWVGARDGLYRVDAKQDRIVDAGLTTTAEGGRLSNVTALQPTPDGGLWAGTFGEGLYRLEPHSNTLVTTPLGPTVPGAQNIDGGALALDRAGTLFVGTFGAGLFRASPRIPGLKIWKAASANSPGLANQDVYAVLAVPDGLLVGSFGGGLDRIDVDTGKVASVPLPVPASVASRVNGITDLLRARDGAIWAATNEGVYRWNREDGHFRYYQPEQPTGPSANPGYSFALFQDREDRIWIGAAGGGLYLYQPASDMFRNFRPQAKDPHSLSDDFVTAMIEDHRGRFWIGTRSGGINICRLGDTLECNRIATGTGTREVSHDHITSLLQAADGAIWAGTAGGGLNRITLDPAGDVASVQQWTRDNGLVDDNVMALAFAPDGALWMSTHGGFARLDPASGKLVNLTPSYGLPTAVFNPKAAVMYRGKLYFGSAKGVVALDPTRPLKLGPAPSTVIEDVLGLDDAERLAVPAWQLRTLSVAWHRPFSLELAVLGYGAGQPQFQYRLSPTESWIDLGDRSRLTLHALAPGHHQLEVRGRRGGHPWTTAPVLGLYIVPPLWRQTWVQVGAAALLLALLFGGLVLRMRELETRNRNLQRAHFQRQEALAEANASRDQLQQTFEVLRRMTMRFEAAKEDERRHLARELHDEFGQALTGAKINLGLALARSPSTDTDARITDTIGLIEGLIAQVRALSLDLRPPLLDEMGLLPALEGYLHNVSGRSGIPVEFQLDPSVTLQGYDRQIAVFRIIQEAVTNALRHSAASRLRVDLTSSGDGVNICVQDDGKGFDAECAMAASAPGLGLFGMRERVYDLGGQWSLDSRPGQGTTVRAFIPGGAPNDPTMDFHARHIG